ncbi:RNA polymerase sigma factor [Catenuloplanes japonicus]|uniref:RNA polymerase sigma factor n=1 Tax=Catenuloplanes japonicus TaxID=33876 RepID=UPI00068B552B|nr:sigma-70 family RNA polymerase sigma factor [Catenuloplanes japonicus]
MDTPATWRAETREDDDLAGLVTAASRGDRRAWDTIVARYGRMVSAVCRQWRLSDADTADVSQTVWLRLFEQLDRLRDPRALPAWLLTTTRRECHHLHRAAKRELPGATAARLEGQADATAASVDDGLLRRERGAAVRAAFDELPPHCRELLELLLSDPPTPYGEISDRLGMPCGGIGPNRARCLERLRRNPRFRAFMTDPGPRHSR